MTDGRVDLLRVQWRAAQRSAHFDHVNDQEIPVVEYVLNDGAPPDKQVRLILPAGNDFVLDFVLRSLRAGQNLLNRLPDGVKFKPDEAMPTIASRIILPT